MPASSLLSPIAPSALRKLGSDLVRPECVMALATGDIFASHFGGGVTHLRPDGARHDILGKGDPTVATNGFALLPGGGFLCANLLPPGGVWKIGLDGTQEPFLLEVEGEALPSVNFVHVDAHGRTWVTVSTRAEPRALGYRPDVASGFIILVEGAGAHVMADDLAYTNEAKVSPDGQWLYVNETFGRRTSRFRIRAEGALGPRQTVAEYGAGTFPDGLEFDVEGGLWITSIVSNRVIRVAPDGQQRVVIEDSDPAFLAEVEAAYQVGEMGRPHLDRNPGQSLRNVSSIAFAGPDLRTAYLGCLLDDGIRSFEAPVAGVAPPHWHFSGF